MSVFIAALFTIAKKVETTHVSMNRRMDKQTVIHTHTHTYIYVCILEEHSIPSSKGMNF